jgi:anti-anti-sigma factor
MAHRNDTGDIQVLTTTVEGVACVSVAGEVDLSSAHTLKEHITRCLRTEPPVLVIDMTRVTFLGSSGLAVLVAAHDHTEVRVVATSQATLRPLGITALDRVLGVYPTVSSAVEGALAS